MEDLYKYLKPVIGDTADILALERELRINKGEILLEAATAEIKVGKVLFKKELYDFGISKYELTNHCFIAGRTGAGKTNTSAEVLAERKKAPKNACPQPDSNRCYKLEKLVS
jgi:DNA helicase HerA-like ATPase